MFLLYYAPDAWEEPLRLFLEGRSPVKEMRQFYRLRQLRSDWRSLLPEGFALESVDRALLDRTHLHNLDALIEEMCSERESVADFMDKSFGVCLVGGDEIVGWCLSEYNSGSRCEVGIQTFKPYRRRGLATLMASALIEYALSRGITQVGWHCYASNRSSVATALKVGFEKVRDYPVFLARFDKEDRTTQHTRPAAA
jgi:RimJ/RimL family protein N-acetyltransferase